MATVNPSTAIQSNTHNSPLRFPQPELGAAGDCIERVLALITLIQADDGEAFSAMSPAQRASILANCQDNLENCYRQICHVMAADAAEWPINVPKPKLVG